MADEKDSNEKTEVDAGSIGPEDRTVMVTPEGATATGSRAQKMKPPYLVIVDGPFRATRFPLHEGKNTIGRLPTSTVVLEDQSVSRQHSVLTHSPEGWILQDLQSKNGSYVNGTQIADPVTIGHKDLLRFGIYTFRLILQEISSEEELAPIPKDMTEWGTVVVRKAEEGSETGALPSRSSEETDRHAVPSGPEGEAGEIEEAEEEPETPSPKSAIRTWALLGLLFVTALGAGLYFYWHFVLEPQTKKTPVAKAPPAVSTPVASTPATPPGVPGGPTPSVPEVASIPLGPPEPPPPQEVPVFLDCVASPLPATVMFQGKELGKTPLKVNVQLAVGKDYTADAVFEMPEIQERYTATTRFVVAADQSVVPLLFRAPMGLIKIEELPRDVSVYFEAYFDYNKFQARPIKLPQVTLSKPIYAPFGRYIMELRQPKQVGSPPTYVEDIILRREFVLAEDQPVYSVVVNEQTLKEFPVWLTSTPSEADVFIDQQKVGKTPYQGTLTLGKHNLILRKDGYFEYQQEIDMTVNMTYKAEIPLKTSAAGEKIIAGKEAFNRGTYEEAIQQLAQVFDLSPSDPEVAQTRYLLGQCYLQLGDFPKAEGYFEQARDNPDFKYWALLGIAQVYGAQQQVTAALPPLVEVFMNATDEEVKKQANAVFQKISPLKSVVYVYTDPAGAAVFVNEKKIEQATPVILHEMGLGNYRLRVEKAGYKPQELVLSLSVTEFKPVLITLKPNP